ncbi:MULTISPECIES: hypothetical protein [Sphingomonas]|uniref:Uncharacterized protein n=1 Tax=Sphingomonas trueperi TaxID=53317 RepID=A0A7X5XZ67_9SPHN|nr:hypothetical protein [Sphingomonas trueperi]NJB98064.1 hypothetical protein [Sphingomonas trueperi]
MRKPLGHNGGPPLDTDPPRLPDGACCARCRHWRAPSEREESDYRAYQMGLIRRRVAEPSGACDRVILRPGGPIAFAGTKGRSRCYNFEAKPEPAYESRYGQAFVTIYENDRVVWQGREGEEPAEYRQGELF